MATVTVPITNPNLDQGFYNYQDAPELLVAKGWTPYWATGDIGDISEGYLVRPEFKPETKRTIHGTCGQKFFTTFATHDAGLYQQVAVPEGAILTLEAEVQYWSKHTDRSGGGYGLQVGIDPLAQTDPHAPNITWGQWIGQDTKPKWDGRSWRTVKVTAVATGPRATIYLRGACRFRAKHNDAYWDQVTLTADLAPVTTDPDLKSILEGLQHVSLQLATIHRGLAAVFTMYEEAPE